MIHIHPFKAWRPKPELVEQAACVPYDVIDTEEARQLAEGRPDSFLHVIRPEIDLPEETDLYDDQVYQTGAANLKKMQDSGVLVQEDTPQLYLYQQQMGTHTQTGLYSCVSVRDYDEERILKHELTRPDKEDDRTRHILTQRAHAEPVMLTYEPDDDITRLTNKVLSTTDPVYSFTAVDGVIHRVWQVRDPRAFVDAFRNVEKLYVADGHHRCKSASRVAEKLRDGDYGDEEFEFFPAVIIPMDEMRILSYNRIIHNIPQDFLEKLGASFELTADVHPAPQEPGNISLYTGGRWYGLQLPGASDDDAVAKLDVSRLHKHILLPLLGIENQRTDPNISFVGGIRGTEELERLVDEGKAGLAISMYPTSIEELTAVADNGQLMPPKSTWFEPKLRSGLLVHTF
ncbi:DUF1015 domain-containing protein [Natronogracilivirga saccharolytica]|uniref:DUF1015 domain-containing protein n=1 Tax=Natronogracilivirga saccharolytica TaxID=2812953 RepID=A0A8J7RNN5_9BACT|nr:DUF1015 family protein [Natronogracilivirga saccharolytica]MBP3193368.1 DUF1015 domain-containing protein [Natronogracilivirga saccharolytica]